MTPRPSSLLRDTSRARSQHRQKCFTGSSKVEDILRTDTAHRARQAHARLAKQEVHIHKKITAVAAGLGLAALVIVAVVGIQVTAGDASAMGGPVAQGPGVANYVDPDVSTPLTAGEVDGLACMRDEERLAQDVYALLAGQYDARVFANISRSETQHTETVKAFMDAFQLTDPAAGREPGSYANGELQALYLRHVARGSQSWADAVNVGIAVEKQDIADLQQRIAGTDRVDLKAVYENLLRASENHLDAFTRQLDGTAGGTHGYGDGDGYRQGTGQGYGTGMGRCVD